jgi:hypothetical protein
MDAARSGRGTGRDLARPPDRQRERGLRRGLERREIELGAVGDRSQGLVDPQVGVEELDLDRRASARATIASIGRGAPSRVPQTRAKGAATAHLSLCYRGESNATPFTARYCVGGVGEP